MRLEARVLEGDEQKNALVPLRSLTDFKAKFGHGVNHYIDQMQERGSGVDMEDWEPWLVWHTMTRKHGETRAFDAWIDAVEWVGVFNAANELDPSGGEATPTSASSPDSSSTSEAGTSSSTSTTSSSPPSGTSSKE